MIGQFNGTMPNSSAEPDDIGWSRMIHDLMRVARTLSVFQTTIQDFDQLGSVCRGGQNVLFLGRITYHTGNVP